MAVLIRHGKKAWNNGFSRGKYPFDPPLVRDHEIQIPEGIPERIVCSPFLRCRQTAQILSDHTGAPISIDSNLREYLGNWTNVPLQYIDPETSRHIQEPLIETYEEFRNRVLRARHYLNQNVWIVTHWIVIRVFCEAESLPDFYLLQGHYFKRK